MLTLREKIGKGNFKLYAVNSSAARVKIVLQEFSEVRHLKPNLILALTANQAPYKNVYKISLWDTCYFYDDPSVSNKRLKFMLPPEVLMSNVWEFNLTWYNNTISLTTVKSSRPIFTYSENICTKHIGYLKFSTLARNTAMVNSDWHFEAYPLLPQLTNNKKIDDGKLHWKPMEENGKLPRDALIGGIEDEPTYIIKTRINNLTVPGKYVPAFDCGFYTFHSEIVTRNFKVLCGYDAKWVRVRQKKIPENALLVGSLSNSDENLGLYVGRAFLDNKIMLGAVRSDGVCYLAHMDRMCKIEDYEILVVPE